MAETKYGKYILSELRMPKIEAPWSPPNLGPAGGGRSGRVLYLDSSIVPGAYYMECVWVMPRPPVTTRKTGTEAHTHDYDEIIAFIGTNPEDPYDLGAEVELWLDDEKHIITRTSLVFIPAGLKHAPLYFLKVERPVFHFTTGPAKLYF
ncbi:MAG: hypothetical protein N2506_07410 [Dehalococcoidales bacterium]|nr:hypothetical protein [Dehalococcoidales bacterium]